MATERSDDGFQDENWALKKPAPLRDVLGILDRQSRLIWITFVLGCVAATVATALFPLRYEAQTSIMLTSKSIPDEYVPTTIIAGIVEQFSAIQSEVFSRDHLSKIIEETGLYADEWDKVNRLELVGRLKSAITVSEASVGRRSARRARDSVVFDLTMRGDKPDMLATVLNTTVAHLINENVKYRSRQARLTTGFMHREYERADKALREHQRELAQFREENRGALPEERAAAISRLDRLEEQRRSAILRQNDLQARLANLQDTPAPPTPGDNLDTVRAELENAKILYTDDHPKVRSLKRQVRAMETTQLSGDGSPAYRPNPERTLVEEGVNSEQARLAQIDQEVERLEALIARTSIIAEDYEALLRRETILHENYSEYLRKVKSAELSLSLESAQQGAQLLRIDPAVPPTSPRRPRWQIAVLGFVGSIGLALGLAVLRELIYPVIIDEQHLEDTLSIPLLGSIAKIS